MRIAFDLKMRHSAWTRWQAWYQIKRRGERRSVRYTHHHVRATTINVLLREGVNGHSIVARTGHRSVDSIQPYIGQQTADQKRNESGVLVAALGAPRWNSCDSSSSAQTSDSAARESAVIIKQSTSAAQQSTSIAQHPKATAPQWMMDHRDHHFAACCWSDK